MNNVWLFATSVVTDIIIVKFLKGTSSTARVVAALGLKPFLVHISRN